VRTPTIDEAARLAFDYLAEVDPIEAPPYDAVMGFGMFDLSLPRFCGELYSRGQVQRIIFTGGIGAGTGDLGGREADVWQQTLVQAHPTIPAADLVLENQSTNTGENVSFTADLIARTRPDLAFGVGIHRVIIVASPTRLRRTWLTLRRQHPGLGVTRRLPSTTMARDAALYASQGLDYHRHLLGELDRLVAYPARGWIVDEPLPPALVAAREVLRLG